ncbi:MAG: hypothetical protein G01um101430_63 [Parcubacteria group bacterium Gr01-1014_30]|nr:MAG: hypothetical protein G01um101430_63 [Parcubacteria group bacterium Gr01-1014_30]
MDKAAFVVLIIVTALLGGGIIYFHIISNTPAEDLMGVDSNNNGVRDDVEDYINSKFSKPEEGEALMQYAKRLQLQMASYQNPEESNRLRVSSDDSYIDCAEYIFGQDRAFDLTDEINEVVINTPSRQRAYDQFNRNLTGGVFGLGEEPSISDCEFYNDLIDDWKLYRNEEYGFEFKYPELGLNPAEINQVGSMIEVKYWSEQLDEHSLVYTISITENEQGLDLFNWYTTNIDPERIVYKNLNIDIIRLKSGAEMYKINTKTKPIPNEYLDKYGPIDALAYIMTPDERFVLTISGNQETGLSDKDLDLIVSTLKFIK